MTGVRIDGRGHWNWVFQNADVVIHVVRPSRGADVVAEVLGGHRPTLWVSDLYAAQQGHAEAWQVCLAHQLRDCQYAMALNQHQCHQGPFRLPWAEQHS
jgi:transposase